MAIDENSTLAQIRAEVDANAGYWTAGSASTAAAYIKAVTMLITRLGKRVSGGGGEEVEHEIRSLRDLLNDARAWYAANAGVDSGGAGVVDISVQEFRT